ncbi:ion transporter [Actinokineospora guangxiensis]|uniref:Ion transporter n=1 Tax=Actinokineospora guangxiensis TaxID=1490288 RepID=A0ABW0EW78_9PSEU
MVVSLAGSPKKPRVSLDDWLMMVLAVVSVGLLVYRAFFDPPAEVARTIQWIDWGICGVFFIEFLWRWSAVRFQARFLRVNWYDIVGMVPVTNWGFRAFRLLRAVRIAMVLTRVSRPADRSVGEELAYRALGRFGDKLINPVVDLIKKPLTVAVLEEVVAVLRTGHYARNVSAALEENRAEIRAMVLEKIKQDRQAGRFSVLPFHDEIVGTVTDTVLRVVLEMLADPRTDELISDMLRENIDQIRAAVHAGDHRDLPAPAPPDR